MRSCNLSAKNKNIKFIPNKKYYFFSCVYEVYLIRGCSLAQKFSQIKQQQCEGNFKSQREKNNSRGD